jgi:plastocyanin
MPASILTKRLAQRLAIAASFAIVALGVASAAPSGGAVTIDNFTFNPAPIVVAAGTQVTWTNNDDVPHTVRADDASFHSAALDTGETFKFVFNKPGVYSYFCSIHPKMVGKVIVK